MNTIIEFFILIFATAKLFLPVAFVSILTVYSCNRYTQQHPNSTFSIKYKQFFVIDDED